MARDPSIYTSDLKAPLTPKKRKRTHTAVNDDTLGHTVRQSGNILHHIDTQPIGVAYIRWTSSNFLHAGD
ncbi:8601_t:CDS:2 [Rhizophagus irregularis]|nr:8601_t:CDS:2 [Rhizophagus irregularis]